MASIIVGLLIALGPALLYFLDWLLKRGKRRSMQQARQVMKPLDSLSQTQPLLQSLDSKEEHAPLYLENATVKHAPSKLTHLSGFENPLNQTAAPTRLKRHQLRLAAHKVATEEYYNGKNCPAFDYDKFATEALTVRDIFMGMKVRSQVMQNKWTAETRFYNKAPRELTPIDFGANNAGHWLPKEGLDSLIESSRQQLALVGPYEALKLLLPYHIMKYFKLRPPAKFVDAIGRIRISNMGSGPDWTMSIDGAYSRSYLARMIVFQGLDWGEVIQVAEFMLRRKIIIMPAEHLQIELEALRWCAKYWYRALAFGEPINFDYDTAKWSPYRKRKSVGEFSVPPLLQLDFNDYNILSTHRKKPRTSVHNTINQLNNRNKRTDM